MSGGCLGFLPSTVLLFQAFFPAYFRNLPSTDFSLEGVIRRHSCLVAFPLTTRLVFYCYNVPYNMALIYHQFGKWETHVNLKQLVVYWISPVRLSLHSKDTFYILYRKTYPTGVYPNMMLWKNRATACGNGSNRYVQFVGNDLPQRFGNETYSPCRNWFPSKSATAGDFQCSKEKLHGPIPGDMIQFGGGNQPPNMENPCNFKSTWRIHTVNKSLGQLAAHGGFGRVSGQKYIKPPTWESNFCVRKKGEMFAHYLGSDVPNVDKYILKL